MKNRTQIDLYPIFENNYTCVHNNKKKQTQIDLFSK